MSSSSLTNFNASQARDWSRAVDWSQINLRFKEAKKFSELVRVMMKGNIKKYQGKGGRVRFVREMISREEIESIFFFIFFKGIIKIVSRHYLQKGPRVLIEQRPVLDSFSSSDQKQTKSHFSKRKQSNKGSRYFRKNINTKKLHILAVIECQK